VGLLINTLKNVETVSPSVPGSRPECFKEPIRGFHDLLRQKPPSLLILLRVEFKLSGLPDNAAGRLIAKANVPPKRRFLQKPHGV
jgi:hypothetical protein